MHLIIHIVCACADCAENMFQDANLKLGYSDSNATIANQLLNVLWGVRIQEAKKITKKN